MAMKQRYLYYRISGELCEKEIKMWRIVDTICNMKHSLEELERFQSQLADIQAEIEEFKRLNTRILRRN